MKFWEYPTIYKAVDGACFKDVVETLKGPLFTAVLGFDFPTVYCPNIKIDESNETFTAFPSDIEVAGISDRVEIVSS